MRELEPPDEEVAPYKEQRDTLLKKYDIPVTHLDFAYVANCTNGRELEKILQILLSGEEGYYPDLIKKTEERLNLIKPNSKYARKTTAVLDFKHLDEETKTDLQRELDFWLNSAHGSEIELKKYKKTNEDANGLLMPGVRQTNETVECCGDEKNQKVARIKATDYSSWDKYDPDTELLKIDLQIEKEKKRIQQRKNKEVEVKENSKNAAFLTVTEATFEANREREKGNEYFKAKEYKLAITHYANSINFKPSVYNHNNRAIAYMKLKRYEKAIRDCKAALNFDRNNLKSNLRLAQIYETLENYQEALPFAEKTVTLDPNNTTAQNLLNRVNDNLNRINDNLAVVPKKSTRIKITDIEVESHKKPKKSNQLKSILKRPDKVVVPIPGPSTMPEPYFVTVENEDPEVIRKHEFLINNRPQMLFMGNIDNDDSDCVEIHVKTNDKNCEECDDGITELNGLVDNLDVMNLNVTSELPLEEPRDEEDSIRDQNCLLGEFNSAQMDLGGGGGEPHLDQGISTLDFQDVHMPFTFLKLWKSVERDRSYLQHAQILRHLEPQRLFTVIGYKLDGKMLGDMIRTLYLHFTVVHETEKVHALLETIVSLPRFNIVAMFLSRDDKTKAKCLFDFLSQHGTPLPDRITSLYLL